MRSLAELLRLSLDEIRADGATEIVFECNEDGLQIRACIDGAWHRVVPVSMTMLTKVFGLRGDLFGAVLSFFQAEEQTNMALTSDRPGTGDAGAFQLQTDGTRIRITWE